MDNKIDKLKALRSSIKEYQKNLKNKYEDELQNEKYHALNKMISQLNSAIEMGKSASEEINKKIYKEGKNYFFKVKKSNNPNTVNKLMINLKIFLSSDKNFNKIYTNVLNGKTDFLKEINKCKNELKKKNINDENLYNSLKKAEEFYEKKKYESAVDEFSTVKRILKMDYSTSTIKEEYTYFPY